MLRVPAPAALDGAMLRDELAARGVTVAAIDMALVGDDLEFPSLEDEHSSTVEAVIAAHAPLPPAPLPSVEERLAAVEAELGLDPTQRGAAAP